MSFDFTIRRDECMWEKLSKTARPLVLYGTGNGGDKLIDALTAIPHSVLNGDRENRLPGNVHLCFEGIEGESLLLLLDDAGVEASSGSACTSGSLDPSHVLLALGRPHEVAHGSLRLTLSYETTEEEVDHIIEAVPRIVAQLREISPVWDALERGERPFIL